MMTTPTAMKPADPLALLRTRRSVALLVLATLATLPLGAVLGPEAPLFGSPLPAAFLLMEVAGLGGAMLDIAAVP